MTRNRVEQDENGLPKWKNSREVVRVVHRSMGLRLVMLSCGKDNCRMCNGKHSVNRFGVRLSKMRLEELFRHEDAARVRAELPVIKDRTRKPLHGPYFYLLRYRGRYAKQWLIGRQLFGKKLKAHPDKEDNVVAVLRGTKMHVADEHFGYVPAGWTEKDEKEIGGGT